MWRSILFFIFLNNAFAEETLTVMLEDGGVSGTKFWDGDFYEFYGVPYAEAPTGRDKYQAPLPVKPWKNVMNANSKNVMCHQSHFSEDHDDFYLSGEEDCLTMDLLVPELASENNLVPIVVYIHSGAFAGGSAGMTRFHYLARHDIIVISFNYRVGAKGFACLGNKEIPGNAGLKDQVAALKWIKKNIKKFGGNPNKVTLAGFSVGASMAELLTLSKTTDGLINQLILESGSALSPFAINRDPIATAKNLALTMGYNGPGSIEDVTEFYLNVSMEILTAKSINFFLTNSTFGFSPCIENILEGVEPFLTESPLDILKKGQNSKIPILTGFSNMEGISRLIRFGKWREEMTDNFSNFLPADLVFGDDKSKQAVIEEIQQHYFKGKEVTHDKIQGYVDYFSDVMFKYSIIQSLRLHAAGAQRPLYLYEFSYVGKLSMEHRYMDRIKGASHRDQTAYILDFFGWTNSYKDLEMRDRMTTMWSDFVKYGDPTTYESLIISYKWLPYSNQNQNYLQISKKPTMKKNLFIDGYNFWNKVYEKYYWTPTAPKQIKQEDIDYKESKVKQKENTAKIVVNNEKKAEKDIKESATDQDEKKKEQKVSNAVKREDSNGKQEKLENNKIVDEAKKINNNVKQESINKNKVVKEAEKKYSNAKHDTIKENKVVNEAKKKDNHAKNEVPKKKLNDVKKESVKEKKLDQEKN